MSQENVPVPAADPTPAPVEQPPQPPAVQSPPAPKVPAPPATPDPRAELKHLADQVAKRGTRKLLWDYLKLRGQVLRK